MWVIGKGIEWQGRNSARPWQTSLLAATAPPAFGARWPTAGRRPCLVYAIPFGHRRQSRPYHVAAGTLPREEASRGRPVELGGEDAPALDGTDPAHKAKVQPRRQVCDIVLRIDKAEPGVTPRTALWWYTMLACLLWSGYAVHGFQKFLHTHNTHTPARRPEISAFHKRECRRLNNTTGMYMLCRG